MFSLVFFRFIYASNLATYCEGEQHVLKAVALMFSKYFFLHLFDIAIAAYLFFLSLKHTPTLNKNSLFV